MIEFQKATANAKEESLAELASAHRVAADKEAELVRRRDFDRKNSKAMGLKTTLITLGVSAVVGSVGLYGEFHWVDNHGVAPSALVGFLWMLNHALTVGGGMGVGVSFFSLNTAMDIDYEARKSQTELDAFKLSQDRGNN